MNRPRTRRTNLVAVLLSAITIPLAIFTLLGIEPLTPSIGNIGQTLIQIAGVVGAIAVIIGILNLLNVHM